MRVFQQQWFLVIVVLFLMSIIFVFCDKQDKVGISEQATHQDSTQARVQESLLNHQSDFEENVDLLIQLINEKEAELKKAQQEMKIKAAELAEKQKHLEKIKSEIRRVRNFSYVILIVGLILIVIGIIFIRSERMSKQI